MLMLGLLAAAFVAPGFEDPSGPPVAPPVYQPVAPPEQTQATTTTTTRVTVSGCIDVPGIGKVCLDQNQNQARSPEDAQARSAIHTLAVSAEQRTSDVFDDYSRARGALVAIDQIAGQYGSDPICHAIAVTAEQTLGQTSADWDPFGQDKLFRSIDTIVQLSQ